MRWTVLFALLSTASLAQKPEQMNDVHVHLTNYVQEGLDARALLAVMGDRVSRAALFGIPLQQQWSYENSGDFAPWYYLQTDAPLYYYSFTDAQIAMAYKSLPPALQARFDPMITGFNPADMYAADHIRRVLTIFPGVFSGIGEFTVHKEFVSSKVAGEVASLRNPALDRIFDLAAEVGLPVLLHCDADVPFPKPDQEPYFLKQLRDLVLRHPKTTVIWAHAGVGRIVRPVMGHIEMIARTLELGPPELFIDLSWDETAKYVTHDEQSIEAVAKLINAYPTRFLFGTDEVAPKDQKSYLKVYEQYRPLLDKLTPEARAGFLKKNYERIFDKARRDVRAWEAKNRPPPK